MRSVLLLAILVGGCVGPTSTADPPPVFSPDVEATTPSIAGASASLLPASPRVGDTPRGIVIGAASNATGRCVTAFTARAIDVNDWREHSALERVGGEFSCPLPEIEHEGLLTLWIAVGVDGWSVLPPIHAVVRSDVPAAPGTPVSFDQLEAYADGTIRARASVPAPNPDLRPLQPLEVSLSFILVANGTAYQSGHVYLDRVGSHDYEVLLDVREYWPASLESTRGEFVLAAAADVVNYWGEMSWSEARTVSAELR